MFKKDKENINQLIDEMFMDKMSTADEGTTQYMVRKAINELKNSGFTYDQSEAIVSVTIDVLDYILKKRNNNSLK